MKKPSVVLLVGACALALGGCVFYRTPPFEAWVIDAESGKPLEGVIAVAHWQAVGGVEGLNPVGEVMIVETVTGPDGRIFLPRWSKISTKSVKKDRPQLILFKNGYNYRRLINEQYSTDLSPYRLLESEWNGKRIKMAPFKGTPSDYYEDVWQVDFWMAFARRGSDCNWKKTPRMLTALHEMSIYFEVNGIRPRGDPITRISDFGDEQRLRCGEPEEFFADYLKYDYTQ